MDHESEKRLSEEAMRRWQKFLQESVDRVEAYVDEQFRIARKLSSNVDVIEDALRRVLSFSDREVAQANKILELEAEVRKMKKIMDRIVEILPKTDPILNRAMSEWEKEK